MKHKSTQFTGGPTIVTIEISLGELLGLQEILGRAYEFMEDNGHSRYLAYRHAVNITNVINQAKDHQNNFTA